MTMKNKILNLSIIISTLLLLCACTQQSDIEKAENELIKLYSEVGDEAKFNVMFKNLIRSNPETMNYSFSKLQEDNLHLKVLESSDGNLRIYSYFSGFYLNIGGYNIFQYKYNGKIVTTQDKWFHSYICSDRAAAEEITDIKTLTVEGKTYYLIFAGKYDDGEFYRESEFGVTAFTIENNLLKTAPIFKDEDKILPNLFVCAVIDERVCNYSDFAFYYDEKEKFLFIPYSNEFGLDGNWIKYEFVDGYFQKW
jgi:hypothetical protein